ncbi:hypothetical protein [Nesterenkonia pannonica]|uniref:hypothetical protein n=1 Tax=Nesterenkonia pannonica TaxID=1548602 RepID=UPI0021645294|nr:hypothetical protein [Nesterenkonia pannonica]
MIFHVQATFTRHIIATLEYFPAFDGWTISPQHCDLTRRKQPRDGYRFAAPGESVAVHRESLHAALLRLRASGEHTISIRGLQYLRRLKHEPVLGPQNMERSTHGS